MMLSIRELANPQAILRPTNPSSSDKRKFGCSSKESSKIDKKAKGGPLSNKNFERAKKEILCYLCMSKDHEKRLPTIKHKKH